MSLYKKFFFSVIRMSVNILIASLVPSSYALQNKRACSGLLVLALNINQIDSIVGK